MRGRTSITVICWGLLLAGAALGFGEQYENTMFDENVPGYLYSFGKRKYLGFVNSSGKNYFRTVSERKDAGVLNLRTIRDPMGAYAVFTSANPTDYQYCKQTYTPYNSSNTASVMGCPGISVLKDSSGVSLFLKPFDASGSFTFVFSPAVVAGQRAVRLYHKGQCLTVTSAGSATLNECEYSDVDKKSRQLFVWIDIVLFGKRVHPLFSINHETNPGAPYYTLNEKY